MIVDCRNFYSMSLLFLSSILCSVSAFASNIVFDRTFGGKEQDFAYSIIQTKDNGLVIAGSFESTAGNAHPWLFKLDDKGNDVWSRVYYQECGYAGSLIQDDKHNLIVAGSVNAQFNLKSIKSSGDLLWSQRIGSDQASFFYDIVDADDEVFYVAGKGKHNLIKTSSLGEPVWSMRIGEQLYSLARADDGSIVVAGDKIYKQLTWSYIPSMVVSKLDQDGSVLWENPLGKNFLGRISIVIATSDNGFLIAGSKIEYMSDQEWPGFLFLCKLGKMGNVEWIHIGDKYSEATSAVQLQDGSFVIATSESVDSGAHVDIGISKFRKDGVKEKTKLFGGAGWQYPSEMILTNDGGLAVAAQTDSQGAGRYDIWVFKLSNISDF